MCRSSRKNLEEEVKELKDKVAEMSSETGEAAVQKLQDEIKFCKSILQCLVCRDRPKEVRKPTWLFLSVLSCHYCSVKRSFHRMNSCSCM